MIAPFLLAAVLAQEPVKAPPPASPKKEQKAKPRKGEREPVVDSLLDDEPEKPKEYTVNPPQAEQEIKVGNFYLKKGNTTAAIRRYEEATRWHPTWAVPYLKLGQAYEQKDEPERAAMAYRKFLEMAPNDKQARNVRKKIERLEREAQKEN
jgi:tetratricopeptide (TPR) repeat protein